MATADLDSCRARLKRGKEKLDALEQAVRDFFADADPYRIVPEQDADGLLPLVVRIMRTPSLDDWADDVGEIAGAIRAALDHLVYQLALDSGASVTKRPRTQFPIFIDEGDYRNGGSRSPRSRMLGGVADKYRVIIDNLQPFQRRVRVESDPLALLRALSDRDKHRDRCDAFVYVRHARFEFLNPDGFTPSGAGIDWSNIRETGEPTQAIRDGAIVAPARYDWHHGRKVQLRSAVVGTPVFDVAFRGDQIVRLGDLDRIILHAFGIIERFQSLVRR